MGVGILANCANILKRKGALSLYEGVFFNALSNWISFYLSLFNGRDGAEAWTGATVPE